MSVLFCFLLISLFLSILVLLPAHLPACLPSSMCIYSANFQFSTAYDENYWTWLKELFSEYGQQLAQHVPPRFLDAILHTIEHMFHAYACNFLELLSLLSTDNSYYKFVDRIEWL